MTVVRRRARQSPPPAYERPFSWLPEGYYYDPLPRAVAADRSLSHAAKLIYPMLCNLSRHRGYAYISQEAAPKSLDAAATP